MGLRYETWWANNAVFVKELNLRYEAGQTVLFPIYHNHKKHWGQTSGDFQKIGVPLQGEIRFYGGL